MEFCNFILYLLICLLLSFSIGLERQYRKRFIGLRTSILVAIGSYLYVSYSFLFNQTDIDYTRIAGQVVSGMGFLGAGVIIKDGPRVRGLTTAATLWCDAAIGVLCAGGFIKEAIAGTIAILFANVVLRYINTLINKSAKAHHTMEKYNIEIMGTKDMMRAIKTEIGDFINHENLTIYSINTKNENKTTIIYDIGILKTKYRKLEKLISNINDNYDIENINYKKYDDDDNEDFDDI